MLQAVNNYSQPTFGMAFRKPIKAEMREFTRYVQTNEFCHNRGLKNFIKKQKNNRFDIIYNASKKEIQVLNEDKKTVKKAFKITNPAVENDASEQKQVSLPVMITKVVWGALTKPESFLPPALKAAGKFATNAEKEALAEAKAVKKTASIFDSINK